MSDLFKGNLFWDSVHNPETSIFGFPYIPGIGDSLLYLPAYPENDECRTQQLKMIYEANKKIVLEWIASGGFSEWLCRDATQEDIDWLKGKYGIE